MCRPVLLFFDCVFSQLFEPIIKLLDVFDLRVVNFPLLMLCLVQQEHLTGCRVVIGSAMMMVMVLTQLFPVCQYSSFDPFVTDFGRIGVAAASFALRMNSA